MIICLHRVFGDVCICVYASENTYKEYRYQIESTFSTFIIGYYDGFLDTASILLRTEDEEIVDEAVHNISFCCQYLLNPKSSSGLFYLAGFAQEVISHILHCTVLHGSLVQAREKNFLIVGMRKSGKTTLVKHLIDKFDAKYLDDDNVYIKDDLYIGLNMPIFMRKEGGIIQNYLYETFDEENIVREVFIPSRTLSSISDVDLIIFPCYNPNIEDYSLEKIMGSALFQNLMNNVRFFGTHKKLYDDILKLSKETSAYSVYYARFNWIEKILAL